MKLVLAVFILLVSCTAPALLPVDVPILTPPPVVSSAPMPVAALTPTPSLATVQTIYETALVTRIIDGDTIVLESGKRVRYIGIDTPERGKPFYREAKEKNSDLVLGKAVRMERDRTDRDRYGRLLRYVYVGDTFINGELVRMGAARARYYKPDGRYRNELEALEGEAKKERKGIWGEPGEPGSRLPWPGGYFLVGFIRPALAHISSV